MKYFKLLAVACVALGLGACSQKDKEPATNTTPNVVVSMQDDALSFKENRGIVKVPVKVTGERNGYVVVACKVAEYGSNPAMDDVHYMVSDKSINIAPEDSIGYFELSLVDDRVENEPRQFVLTLEVAEGATIGAPNATVINILDNDHEPYDRIGGEWYMMINGGRSTIVNFNAADEGEAGYKEYYTVENLMAIPIRANFSFDEGTKIATLTFKFGEMTYETAEGLQIVYLGYLASDYSDLEYLNGAFTFTWNSEEKSDMIEWESGPGQEGVANFAIFSTAGGKLSLACDPVMGVTGFEK